METAAQTPEKKVLFFHLHKQDVFHRKEGEEGVSADVSAPADVSTSADVSAPADVSVPADVDVSAPVDREKGHSNTDFLHVKQQMGFWEAGTPLVEKRLELLDSTLLRVIRHLNCEIRARLAETATMRATVGRLEKQARGDEIDTLRARVASLEERQRKEQQRLWKGMDELGTTVSSMKSRLEERQRREQQRLWEGVDELGTAVSSMKSRLDRLEARQAKHQRALESIKYT